VLEAMAAGVPIVASDLPPVREIVTNGVDGRLVRADRPGDLARAIRVLLEHPETMAALGRAGRDRIARAFTWQRAQASLRDVYRLLLNAAADAPRGSSPPAWAGRPRRPVPRPGGGRSTP
jgi:glycosyltransferase involved in cell wall biosynthesis